MNRSDTEFRKLGWEWSRLHKELRTTRAVLKVYKFLLKSGDQCNHILAYYHDQEECTRAEMALVFEARKVTLSND